jgi:hypothetical protein
MPPPGTGILSCCLAPGLFVALTDCVTPPMLISALTKESSWPLDMKKMCVWNRYKRGEYLT